MFKTVFTNDKKTCDLKLFSGIVALSIFDETLTEQCFSPSKAYDIERILDNPNVKRQALNLLGLTTDQPNLPFLLSLKINFSLKQYLSKYKLTYFHYSEKYSLFHVPLFKHQDLNMLAIQTLFIFAGIRTK
jgi:hypothetical protein|tara:strand:- start:40630 stop:41022 length:393 start_codon:yes stop_codon:yes gene_type:complete